jgi:tetratricopeptide (TPR) repeat protein
MIRLTCAGCQSTIQVGLSAAEPWITCPHCRHVNTVPEESVDFAPSARDQETLPPTSRAVPEVARQAPAAGGASETATVPPLGAGIAALGLQDTETAGAAASFVSATVPGYEILAELGRGGMGVVYKARHSALRRIVALKMILGGGHASGADLERFRTEAEAIARLQHPNIVQIYEVGQHDGLPYFSLEFCGGGTLEKKLAGTPLAPREAAALVAKLAEAMQAAHDRGVIHRDLKPANILLQIDDCRLTIAERAERVSDRSAIANLQSAIPKITDFGLAKKLDEVGKTQTGAIMGTPSYMAPEQAAGKSKELGPACDIYALGAILYECLTGRPPFRAATPLDTVIQVLSEEPVPPSRMNAGVPRDLETIVLKCLDKEPQRRYGTAHALALDLRRFLDGEPVQARPVMGWERTWKWVKRHPALAAVYTLIPLVTVLGLVGGSMAWLWQDAEAARQEAKEALQGELQARAAESLAKQAERQAETERAVGVALAKTEHFVELAHKMPCITSAQAEAVLAVWRQADDAHAQAMAAVNNATAASSLRQRVTAVATELEEGRKKSERARAYALRKEHLLRDLDAARMAHAVMVDEHFDHAGAAAQYAAAFAAYDLAVVAGRAEELAQRIRADQPDVRDALVVALDEWAEAASQVPTAVSARDLRALAQAADDDEWRTRYRQAMTAADGSALRQLSVVARQRPLPASSLCLLAQSLQSAGQPQEAIALLRVGRARHLADFWIPVELASLLLHQKKSASPVKLEEAVGCLRAALALRPEATGIHLNLGVALEAEKHWDEAIDTYRTVIKLDPKEVTAHVNLGIALEAKKQLDEAISEYKKAIDLNPKFAKAYLNLGVALRAKNQLPEAIAAYNKAIALKPQYMLAHYGLGNALHQNQQLDEAIAAYRQALHVDPKFVPAYINLGNALGDKGDFDGAIAAYQKAADLDPNFAMAHNNLGRALLAKNQLDEAISEFKKAIALDPKYVYAHHNLGNALQAKKQYDLAVTAYRQAISIDPTYAVAHHNLGLALVALKQFDEAIGAYRQAIALDSKFAQAHRNLGKVLMARSELEEGIAECRKAMELDVKYHYDGACYAALAAARKPEFDKLDDQQRMGLRQLALVWLRADLERWKKHVVNGSAGDRQAARKMLQHWQVDSDLTGVRDAAALMLLPADEAEAWRTLWTDVATLLSMASGVKR